MLTSPAARVRYVRLCSDRRRRDAALVEAARVQAAALAAEARTAAVRARIAAALGRPS